MTRGDQLRKLGRRSTATTPVGVPPAYIRLVQQRLSRAWRTGRHPIPSAADSTGHEEIPARPDISLLELD
jgi:hypothetical protein